MWKICAFLIVVTNCAICSHIDPINHYQTGKENSLHRDLCEFIKVIPIDEIRNLTKHFYANDEAMRESYDYLRNEGLRKIADGLSQISILKKFIGYLNDTGVDFAELKKQLGRILLTSDETKSIIVNEEGEGSGAGSLGGINAFFNEALQMISQEDVFTLFFTKIEQSSAFSGFLEKLSTSDYENMMDNMKQNHGIRELYFDLHAHGIDALEWVKSLKGFAGY
ncbi:hypothetical protein PVAND_009085 [Polypedilum vanderplanki]|uniref:Uncharacterized protein n=1 Tax=Polypedilum vanderplanki TaxID=319348 RepID=A0A9J6CBT5_POLVA|nr:hypothetical protein PVAND_009085 [Polypedilum vanderplanki]